MWDITKLERIGIERQVCDWTTKLSKPGFPFGENSGKRKEARMEAGVGVANRSAFCFGALLDSGYWLASQLQKLLASWL